MMQHHHTNPAMAAAASMLSLTNPAPVTPHMAPTTIPPNAAAAAASVDDMPRLAILKQNSLSEETYSKNGKQKLVHVVVKNSPFAIQLGLQAPAAHALMPHHAYYTPSSVDLSKVSFDIRLYYDTDQPTSAVIANEKEVDYVKVKPYEFKVPQQQSQLVSIEVRLKVLSSQHEDMFFRVKFLALDPITRRELHPALQCYSEPIKVISKPEQLKKRKPSRKKTINDMLLDTLHRIEQQQLDQQALLDRLQEEAAEDDGDVDMVANADADADVVMSAAGLGVDSSHDVVAMSTTSTTTTTTSPPTPPPNFEAAFQRLLSAYSALPTVEERRGHSRLAVARIGPTPGDSISKLHDLFLSEGLAASLGSDVRPHSHAPPASTGTAAAPPTSTDFAALGEIAAALGIDPNTPFCACTDCPHKTELEKIEGFMKQIVSM